MEGFTIIDGVVAIVIVLSALLAYGRGFMREAMAIVGWVAATIVGYVFAPRVAPLVSDIPFVGEAIQDNCVLAIVVGFSIVLVIALIVFSFFTPLLSALVRRSIFGGLDQGLGFLFGVVRGVLLVVIAFFVYDTVITGQEFTIVDESRSAAVFGRYTDNIQEQDPEMALGWIEQKYENLVSSCPAS